MTGPQFPRLTAEQISSRKLWFCGNHSSIQKPIRQNQLLMSSKHHFLLACCFFVPPYCLFCETMPESYKCNTLTSHTILNRVMLTALWTWSVSMTPEISTARDLLYPSLSITVISYSCMYFKIKLIRCYFRYLFLIISDICNSYTH